MKKGTKTMRESLAAFFAQVYAPDSIPGGILRAARPNESVDWDEEGDTRRIEQNVDSFVKDYDVAVKRLATRKP